jgi:hypothetical protein
METTTLQVWNNVTNDWELKEFEKEKALNLLQSYPKTFKTKDGSSLESAEKNQDDFTILEFFNENTKQWEKKEFTKAHALNLLQGYPKTFRTIDGSTINETAVITTDGKAKTVSTKAKTVASEPDLAVDKTVS